MKQDLYELRYYADMLEQGIDPTSNMKFKNDTVLNNFEIKQYNGKIKKILDKLIYLMENAKELNNKKNKIPFFLLDEQKNLIKLSEESISISELCYRINAVVPSGMKKLRASDVTRNLEDKGYLKSVIWRADKTMKVPTEKGKMLGIQKNERKNAYGNVYYVNLYSLKAQLFIVENVGKLI